MSFMSMIHGIENLVKPVERDNEILIELEAPPQPQTAPDNKIGLVIAYVNRNGRYAEGAIKSWQYDMAGVLSYYVENGDSVSRWNFIGQVVLQ